MVKISVGYNGAYLIISQNKIISKLCFSYLFFKHKVLLNNLKENKLKFS